MPHILDSLWTMITAGDILGFLGGLIAFIAALLLAPILFVGKLVGLGS